MKFFKYLIFSSISLISINSFADYQSMNYRQFTSSTPDAVCSQIASYFNSTLSTGGKFTYSVLEVKTNNCKIKRSDGGLLNEPLLEVASQCSQSTLESNSISVPGWTNWTEQQIESYHNQIKDLTACYDGCLYIRPSLSGSSGSDQLSLTFDNPTKDPSCPAGDKTKPQPPVPSDQNNNQMKPEDCKNSTGSNSYCDKPSDKQCPTGYKQGMFNNKQICIKSSDDPDPNKPNPNDPNNGNGNGDGSCNGTNNCNTTNFDDSGIIAAINSMKSSVSSAISSLSSAISSMSSSLSSAINGTTAAVNANGDKVTSAVNANGDKVTNAVKENTASNNAIKDAINANSKTTSDAINANGKATTDAINAGTEATKENGGKLDGIKEGVEEGNGLLKEIGKTLSDIKDFLTATDDSPKEDGTIEVIENQVDTNFDDSIFQANGSCPAPLQISFTLLQTHTISFDYQTFCYGASLARPFIIFVGMFSAFLIVTGHYRGGSDD